MTKVPTLHATQTVTVWDRAVVPSLVAAADEHAALRFLEFFAANVRNLHTRRAYYRAADGLLAWCEGTGVPSIVDV